MKARIRPNFKWMALVIALILIESSCTGPANESTPSLPTSSPVSAPTQASSPAPTKGQVITPTMAVVPAKESTLPKGVLYRDDFTDPKSGWSELQVDNYYIGYHEPNHYHVEVHAPHDREIVPVPQGSFGDLTVETKVLVSSSNTAPTGDFRYGLVFRRSGNQYYAFAISPRTKTWYVFKSSPTGLVELKQGTNDSIQGLRADDLLRVDAKGSTFFFHINDQTVGQVSDSDYPSGEVGFYVETFDSTRAHIHYGTITIREAETTLPAMPTMVPIASPSTLACTAIGQTLRRPSDNADMVCVPAGQFLMGSVISAVYAQADEKPQHTVYLDAFWIDVREATNMQYNQCIQAGACKVPKSMSETMPGMSMPTQDNQPISDVLWDEAAAYCQWVGGALPTEAQWEKAARGTDGRIYPWGNQSPTCDYAVMNDGSGPACGKQNAPWPVGSKPLGASPYGALDMAGNVWEFTADWYAPNYYTKSLTSNPQGPSSGTEHTVRGGSLFMSPDHVRAAFRGTGIIHAVHGSQGFRCAFRTVP